MEGKELYNNEDEELDPKSKKEQEDADDFGLPEIEDSDDKSGDLGEPYPGYQEDKVEEENYSYSKSSDDYTSGTDLSDSDYDDNNEVDEADSSKDEQSLEEKYGQKKNPVGWIIFGVFVLIAIILGVIWFLNKDTEPEQENQPPPVIEQSFQEPEPEVIEEPEPVAEPVKQPGVYELNEPTGRYHVIVASSIDVDLIHDYGNKLAKQGMTCNIIAPRGSRNFHRLSIADYVSLDDANIKSEQMKGTLGEDVWVIRY